jgi:hypothetical protein
MGDDIWSGNATLIDRTKRPATGKGSLPAMGKPVGVIVHTTGGGIVAKALKKGKDPLAYAAEYYARKNSYGSHYLVAPFAEETYSEGDDSVVGTVPEQLVAYHSGLGRTSGRVKCYKKGRAVWPRHRIASRKVDGKTKKYMKDFGKVLPDYQDWLDRWPGLDSPLDLIPKPWPGAGIINGQFHGVDLLAPEPGAKHTELQVRWVAAIIKDLADRHGWEIHQSTVLRHADVDPFSRSTKRGGWDPPRYVFEMLCDVLGIESWPAAEAA